MYRESDKIISEKAVSPEEFIEKMREFIKKALRYLFQTILISRTSGSEFKLNPVFIDAN